MILDHCELFVAVAKYRNLSHASRELHISQPAVTKQLRLLEEKYNARLYRRTRDGIELMPAGRIFLKSAKRIIQQNERLIERLAAVGSKKEPAPLLVGGSYSPSASLLPGLLAQFQKTHPKVEFQLRTNNSQAVERMLLKGEVELAIINNSPVSGRLKMEFYRNEPIVAFVHPHHPLAGKPRVTREEVSRYGLIVRKRLGGRGTTNAYLRHLLNQGVAPRVVLRCDTPEVVKESVRDRLGVGISFRDVVEKSIKRGEFKAIKLPGKTFEGKSFIAYHKKRALSPVAQEFLRFLRSQRDKV